MTIKRKMGVLEKINSYGLHDIGEGACSISIALKLKNDIDFNVFKQALEVLFKRHPLLRARKHVDGGNHYHALDVKFNDISIELIETEDANFWQSYYSCDIIRKFDLDNCYWRAALVKDPGANHILIGITHLMSDG